MALLIEAGFGYPQPLFRAIRHPVVWAGALIAILDRVLNRDNLPAALQRSNGVVALILVIGGAMLPAYAVQTFGGLIASAVLASTLLAQRSLWEHVSRVAERLEREGLAGGRRAVAMIVGRNPEMLDEAGVARAAIESLAENFSDGVVAPAFWCGAVGLPGIAAYKAVNTADSMIGHRTPRYRDFGWASARFDDLVNLPASRLAALWIVLASGRRAGAALLAVRSDAARHRSPNAGWPEAAMAGALGLRLAGPRVYGTTLVNDAWMGDGRADASAADIRRALALYRRACVIQLVAVILTALVIWRS